MATFNVTVGSDPGTQSDGTTGASGTLSWALAQANAQEGPHVINITVDVDLSGPLSPIFNSVTINGNGHTIDAGGVTRIFMVGVDEATMNDARWEDSIIAERPQVAINDLTLANGLAQGGGASGGGGGLGAGGALFVNQSADVTLTNVSFDDNRAVGGASMSGGECLSGWRWNLWGRRPWRRWNLRKWRCRRRRLLRRWRRLRSGRGGRHPRHLRPGRKRRRRREPRRRRWRRQWRRRWRRR
jgi:hypothetical protein